MKSKIFIIVYCLLTTAACKSDLPTHTQPENKTALFLILGDDYRKVDRLSPQFNRWNNLPKTKDLVHIFVHPNNIDQTKGLEGNIHPVKAEDLAHTMNTILASLNVNRLLFFIATHGQEGLGNWCYEVQKKCELNESLLMDFFSQYSNSHTPKLKEALIIPLSCHHKPLMDRFAIKSQAVIWPNDIFFITLEKDTYCSLFSAANYAIKNEIYEPSFNSTMFNNFFAIKSLQDLVNISQKPFKFVIGSTQKNHKLILLKDFGFDFHLLARLFPKPRMLFPHNETVAEFLDKMGFPHQFNRKIKNLTFKFSKKVTKDIPVDGDLSIVIKDENLAEQEFLFLDVLLENKP